MEIILASGSPRRKELLGLFGFNFIIKIADIDEAMDPERPAHEEVARVSMLKALATPRGPEDIVIAADTIVVCNDIVLGKPKDEADAARMLKLLSGRDHQVMTGMTVLFGKKAKTVTEITDLHFRALSDGEIERYIATKEPMDKAGAYAIQGGGALFAEKMVGDYYNVMGLPVCRLWHILNELAPQALEGLV